MEAILVSFSGEAGPEYPWGRMMINWI